MNYNPFEKIGNQDILDAITEGVRQGIWDIAQDATDSPTFCFYSAIEDGVRTGIKDFEHEKRK